MSTRRAWLERAPALLLGGLTASAWRPAWAQAAEYPTRVVKVVVPFSPGGAVDGPMRAIADALGRQLKQQVIVENRPGAGATIGTELVAKSAPDGYTLLLASQTNAISATLYSRLSFNPIDDFEPITLIGREPGVLVVHPSSPWKTVADLVADARANPGRINYASSGNGSGQHLFAAMFASMAGVQLTHVPYKGSGQAVNDLIAGVVPMAVPGVQAMVKHIEGGKLRALATTGDQRSRALPNVPTLAESGLKGYSAYVWMGLLAPRGTPRPVVDVLQREVKAALAVPEVAGFFQRAGIEVVASTPAEFGAYFREERDRWARVIKDIGAKVD